MTDADPGGANCLALFVHENAYGDESNGDKNNYFVVLDYGKGIYYKLETESFFHGYDKWVEMKALDLTGDGKQEFVVSHIYKKSIEVGVFRCDEKENKLVKLFSTLDDYEDDYLDRSWFSGHLEDDYKAVLEFPNIGYSETVSLIKDGGYSEKQLQAGAEDPNGSINFVACWKDGKLQKRKAKESEVFLYTLDHVNFVSGEFGMPQLELVRGIFVGHRSCRLGNMHMFLQYDDVSGRMTLNQAKYVSEEEAEKEWEHFDEWKER